MTLAYDADFDKVFGPVRAALSQRPQLKVEDIPANRAAREANVLAAFSQIPDVADVEGHIHHARAADGHDVAIHEWSKINASHTQQGSSALLHIHGGAMTMGSPGLFAKPLAQLVSELSIPIFSVDYRLAPEYNGSTLVEDCYTALVWLHKNAKQLGVDSTRIALYG